VRWLGLRGYPYLEGILRIILKTTTDMAQNGPVVPLQGPPEGTPILRDNLLGVPATLVTLMIAAQGVTPTPSSATPRRRSLPRSLVTKLGPLELPHQTI